MPTFHDSDYKLFFSHPEMVRDLLCDWVGGAWIAEADFSTLECINGSYVSEDQKQRHDDMVWRLRLKDRWLWVYLVLEFQSEPDPWMALRMLIYVGLLAQDLVKRGELAEGKLPPILPLVLYNGLESRCVVNFCFYNQIVRIIVSATCGNHFRNPEAWPSGLRQCS